MRDLAPGERVSVDQRSLQISIDGPRLSALAGELGSMLVALDAAKRVAAGFAPLEIGARELRPGVAFGDEGQLELGLDELPAEVDRLLLLLFLTRGPGAGLSFRDFSSLAATIGSHRFTLDLTNRGESAMIMVEIYRRGGGWRLTANGQGFVGGLAALRSALAIDIPVPAPSGQPPSHPGHGGGSDGPRRGDSFSGSGFAVDDVHILTNAHVVEGAQKIEAANDRFTIAAEVAFSDPRNDIALLRVERPLPAQARFRASIDLHLGEDVMVLGFPLQGLLGTGPTATAGNVSALCGIGNDTSVLQFSAPIASGNSGGPILDSSGLDVGLVHSSLNLDRIREGGSNAENINFGAKGATVRSFLSTVGVEALLEAGGAARSRADIVRDARKFIYRIRCQA